MPDGLDKDRQESVGCQQCVLPACWKSGFGKGRLGVMAPGKPRGRGLSNVFEGRGRKGRNARCLGESK